MAGVERCNVLKCSVTQRWSTKLQWAKWWSLVWGRIILCFLIWRKFGNKVSSAKRYKSYISCNFNETYFDMMRFVKHFMTYSAANFSSQAAEDKLLRSINKWQGQNPKLKHYSINECRHQLHIAKLLLRSWQFLS